MRSSIEEFLDYLLTQVSTVSSKKGIENLSLIYNFYSKSGLSFDENCRSLSFSYRKLFKNSASSIYEAQAILFCQLTTGEDRKAAK